MQQLVVAMVVLLGVVVGAIGEPGRLGGVAAAEAIEMAAAHPAGGNQDTEGRDNDTPAPVLLAAGDIAECGKPGAAATAALLRGLPGTVATLGDHAYMDGSPRQFAKCYDPTWGTEKERTRPAPGNHDYKSGESRGYFGYFGEAAGDRGEGYYSYDLGAWHVVVLNSNCDDVGGCDRESPQGRWLRDDLAAHPAACTLAYWHHPLFSSGTEHGGDPAVRPFWQTLADAEADVVLSGHEHNYERFAPQDPNGGVDQERGIRQFVVGTGGFGHYPLGDPLPTSEARNADTFGVLALTLRPTGYDWAFVPTADAPIQADGGVFRDAGSGDCR